MPPIAQREPSAETETELIWGESGDLTDFQIWSGLVRSTRWSWLSAVPAARRGPAASME
jgi:hypothetical protein